MSTTTTSSDKPRRPRRFAGRFEIVRRLRGDGLTIDRLAYDTRTGAVVRLEVAQIPEGPRQKTLQVAFASACERATRLRSGRLLVPLARGSGKDGTVFTASLSHDARTLADAPPADAEEALRVLEQVAESLAWIHERGVVHGALRSQAVVCRGRQALLRGFGWGDLLGPVHGSRAGAVPTPFAGIAPEQARNEAPDPLSDVYAFGALAVRLLSGRDPFEATSARDLAVRHLFDPPPPLPFTDRALAELLLRCLAKDPADRFLDGQALFEALCAVRGRPVTEPFAPPVLGELPPPDADDIPGEALAAEVEETPEHLMDAPPAARLGRRIVSPPRPAPPPELAVESAPEEPEPEEAAEDPDPIGTPPHLATPRPRMEARAREPEPTPLSAPPEPLWGAFDPGGDAPFVTDEDTPFVPEEDAPFVAEEEAFFQEAVFEGGDSLAAPDALEDPDDLDDLALYRRPWWKRNAGPLVVGLGALAVAALTAGWIHGATGGPSPRAEPAAAETEPMPATAADDEAARAAPAADEPTTATPAEVAPAPPPKAAPAAEEPPASRRAAKRPPPEAKPRPRRAAPPPAPEPAEPAAVTAPARPAPAAEPAPPAEEVDAQAGLAAPAPVAPAPRRSDVPSAVMQRFSGMWSAKVEGANGALDLQFWEDGRVSAIWEGSDGRRTFMGTVGQRNDRSWEIHLDSTQGDPALRLTGVLWDGRIAGSVFRSGEYTGAFFADRS